METVKGEGIKIWQTTEEDQELARIKDLLDFSLHPMGTRKLVGSPTILTHKKSPLIINSCIGRPRNAG